MNILIIPTLPLHLSITVLVLHAHGIYYNAQLCHADENALVYSHQPRLQTGVFRVLER